MTGTPALELVGVGVRRDGRALLADVDWTVTDDQRWVVLGPNGSGKTTLLRVATLALHPTTGTVRLLGHELGRVDVRALRARIGYSSASLADQLRSRLTAHEVVVTARHGALEPWWHDYDEADHERARSALARLGVAELGHRTFGTLSSGERQRVLLARTLCADPALIALDEPNAGLDVAGREDLVGALGGLAADPSSPPLVLVTHHLEEVPPGFTHALLLRGGRVVFAGALDRALTDEALSACFGVDLVVTAHPGGRWSARAR